LRLLAKSIKLPDVENFKFKYSDTIGNRAVEKELKDLQAILISPKWADHGFDPEQLSAMST